MLIIALMSIILPNASCKDTSAIDYNQSIRVSIDMPDTIYRHQKEILVTLVVENISNKTISLRDPSLWGNAFPRIMRGDEHLPGMRVKPDIRRLEKSVVTIKPKDSVRLTFNQKLGFMLNLKNCYAGPYSIYFEIYPDKKQKNKILSKRAYFTLVD